MCINILQDLVATFDIIDHQNFGIYQINHLELEGMLRSGLNHISSIKLKMFKFILAHKNPWRWNIGFHNGQYFELFYLPCAALHLVISSAIMVWISTLMRMIRDLYI